MPTFTFSNTVLKLSLSNHTRKRNKRNPNWKRRSKTITDYRLHDTIYRKSKKWPQKTIRINEFHKVIGYKINIQRSIVFLYNDNKLSEREIKKTISCTITLRCNKIGLPWW